MVSLQQIYNARTVSRYYKSRTCSKQVDFREAAKFIAAMNCKNSLTRKQFSKEEAEAQNRKKHKEAERERRSRINKHYQHLRNILPVLIKRDKASVLGETIRHVRNLEKMVSELKASDGVRRECVFPGGADSLRVELCEGQGQGKGLVKVIFTCDDKKKLMTDIERVVRTVGGKAVRAEMMAMGGRTECVMWLQGMNETHQLEMLRTALKPHVEKAPKTIANRPLLIPLSETLV